MSSSTVVAPQSTALSTLPVTILAGTVGEVQDILSPFFRIHEGTKAKKRSGNTIYNNILFSIKRDEGLLNMYSSNGSMMVQTSVKKAYEPRHPEAEFLCSVEFLKNSIRGSKKSDCVVEFASSVVRVRVGSATLSFKPVHKPKEYPPSLSRSDLLPLRYEFLVLKETLSDMVNLLPFASADETRYILNGVYLGKSEMVSTDGRRLEIKPFNPEQVYEIGDSPMEIIMPSSAIQHLKNAGLSMLQKCDHKIRCHVIGKKIEAAKGDESYDRYTVVKFCGSYGEYCDFTIAYTLVEGRYPNYRQVIPSINTMNACVEFTDEEYEALHSTFMSYPKTKDGPSVLISIDNCVASTCIKYQGEVFSTMELTHPVLGPDIKVSVNLEHLLQPMGTLKKRRWWVKDELSPVLSLDNGMHVLMPLRLN